METLKKNTHPMNKEITGLKNGGENPEAAAEEYIEKVTQRENWAGRVVDAKHAPRWFLPQG